MRILPFRSAIVAIALLAAWPPAMAQTTTSQSALDALGSPGAPAKKTPPIHHRARAATPHAGPHSASRHGAKHPAVGHPPAATIPAAPPPAPVFTAPIINVPLHPPAPPPPVPVVPNAAGAVTTIENGVRIGFGAASSDLNPATMQAVHDFSAKLKASPDARAILDAAAAGSPDDPSTPRRLALSRGLAARAVLINDGIASTRIYVRMNPRADAGSDHVDLRMEANDATPTPTPSPGPAPP